MDILSPSDRLQLTQSQRVIQYIDHEFIQATDYDKKNRDRQKDNQNIYWSIDYGQWPVETVADYQRWRRQLVQLNFSRRIIDGLVGSLLTNRFEIDYLPLEGEPTEWAQRLKSIRTAESELMDWPTSKRQAVRDAMIYMGVEEIYVSDQYRDTGNIGFRTLLPGHVVFDPFWRTDRVHDCRRVWKAAYMTAAEILKTYPNAEDADIVRWQAIQDRVKGYQYGTQQGIDFGNELLDKYGSQYKVVEYYELRDVTEKFELDTLTKKELPQTEDVALKYKWLMDAKPGRNSADLPFEVHTRERKKRVLYVTAYCNQIGRGALLSQGEDEIQIGRIKQFPVSAATMNGERSGIMDLIKDPQRLINYRVSLETYIIQTQASGGTSVDTGVFMGDDNLLQEYIKRRADPSYVLKLPAGASNKFPNWNTPLNKAAGAANDAVQQMMRLIDILDRISFHPAASDARTESSGESGVLFAQKAKMAEIANFCMNETIRQHENDKAEAWFLQAKKTHGNNDVEKEFYVSATKERVKVNEHITLFDGSEVIKNRIADVPRHRVVISESPQGETRKLTTMMVANDLLSKLNPAENPISRSILSAGLVQNVDVFSEEQKQELKAASEIEKQLAVSTAQATMAKNKQMVDSAMAPQVAQGAGIPQSEQGMPPVPPRPPQQAPQPQRTQTGARLPNV